MRHARTLRKLGPVLLLAVAAVASGAATGEDPLRASFERAVEHYTRGLDTESRGPRLEEFRASQRLFARAARLALATGSVDADLYTNLGNAALQAEDLGGAILAYRRALRVDADHSRAVQNLAHARALLPGWVPRPEPAGLLDSFFFWHRTIEGNLRQLLAAGCFALAALGIGLGIRFRLAAFRNAAILPALAWVALIASVVADSTIDASEDAVVTLPEVVARAADSALAPSALPEPLPAGVELRVLDRRPPWLRVRLANGRDAWLTESSVTLVRPGPAAPE